MAARSRGGKEVNRKEEIAEVFACLYEDQYASRTRGKEEESDKEEEQISVGAIEAFTPEEVRGVLRKILKGKAADEAGVVTEMLQHGGTQVVEAMAEIYMAILQEDAEPPGDWKIASMRVLHKAGDDKDPGNYHPNCLLPISYKSSAKFFAKESARPWMQPSPQNKQDSDQGIHVKTTCLL